MAHYLRLNYARYFQALRIQRGFYPFNQFSSVRIWKLKCNIARIKGDEFETVAFSVSRNELQRLQVFGSCLFRSTSGNQRGLFT